MHVCVCVYAAEKSTHFNFFIKINVFFSKTILNSLMSEMCVCDGGELLDKMLIWKLINYSHANYAYK